MKPLQFKLAVSILKEGKRFVAYAPALDLSTSGRNLTEVKKRFKEMVEIFFEEIKNKKDLTVVLENLGWLKVENKWVPPLPVAQEYSSHKVRVPA